MTAPALVPTAPTVRLLLFGPDPALPAAAAREALASPGADPVALALPDLSATGHGLVREQVAAAVGRALDIGPGDVLAAAWTTYTELRAAALRTRDEPGRTEVVELATHTLTVAHRITVEVRVDGRVVIRIGVEVVLALVVQGLLAVVADGTLTQVRAGTATGSVQLWLERAKVAERSVTFDIPGAVDLARPIPLLRDRGGAPPVPPAPSV